MARTPKIVFKLNKNGTPLEDFTFEELSGMSKAYPFYSTDIRKHKLERMVGHLDEIKKQIHVCKECRLCKQTSTKNIGEGSLYPEVLFINDMPGTMEPNLTRQHFSKMIELMDIKEYSLIHTVKCQPTGRRSPSNKEIFECKIFLDAQIITFKPKVIIILGRQAEKALIPFRMERGEVLELTEGKFEGIKFIKMHHPSKLNKETVIEQKKYIEDNRKLWSS